MNVPPFVPPQIEIAGNVAAEKYRTRVGFLRRVVGLHTGLCALIFLGTLAPLSAPTLIPGALITLGALLALSLVRGLVKGWRHEQILSLLCVPPLVFGIAMLLNAALASGWPLWVFGLPCLATLGYTVLCGKDISFIGMFVLTSLSCMAVLVGARFAGWLDNQMLLIALPVTIAYLFYFVYDLAALQTRRRLGEEAGAVLDLFRDLLNFTTYPIRVANHWRRHRIWSRN